MYVSEINIEGLKKIYRSKPAAKPTLEYFVTCQSDENVVTVEDLLIFFQKRRYVVLRQDVISLFKDLEKLGVGDFKIGRRTQRTRFVSKISLVSVGQAVIDIDRAEEVNQTNRELEQAQQKSERNVEVAYDSGNSSSLETKETLTNGQEVIEKFLVYSFPLRPNLVVSLNLPVNLTDIEAERLAGFIKALPFNT